MSLWSTLLLVLHYYVVSSFTPHVMHPGAVKIERWGGERQKDKCKDEESRKINVNVVYIQIGGPKWLILV